MKKNNEKNDPHQFLVGVAHGLTLLASSTAPCWGDCDSWEEWLLLELDTLPYAASQCTSMKCTLPSMIRMRVMTRAHLHGGGTGGPVSDLCGGGHGPPCAVWSPAMISCLAMVEQLGLFIACQQRGLCLCYLNGSPLHAVPVAA